MDFSGRSTQRDDLEAASSRSVVERLVLGSLGAAAIVGEGLISHLASLSSRDGAERQVRLLEARGKVERDRIEQEIQRHRSKLAGGLDRRSEQIRMQLRNTLHDLTSKGCSVGSKIHSEMPTNP
jgi:hypothetical protein